MNFKLSPFSITSKVQSNKARPSIFSNNDTVEDKQALFEDLRKKGIEEAEKGNTSKALSYLSHAISLNDKDYKLYEMIAQLHLMEGRPFGTVKFSLKCIELNPNWCEGYITLARGQREMGEVTLSISSYQKAISLFPTSSLNEDDKKEIEQESKELSQLLAKYKSEHGELQGRAHVVEHLEDVKDLSTDYSSMKEIWKDAIQASEQELKEREEEKAVEMDVEESYFVCSKWILDFITIIILLLKYYFEQKETEYYLPVKRPLITLFYSI